MRIAVIGTGDVGRSLAGGLAAAGHEVVIGTRDPDETLARTERDHFGRAPFSTWHADNSAIPVQAMAEAGAGSDVVVNATSGTASVSAMRAVGAATLYGRVVLDVSNPLVFENGELRLMWPGTDSVAENIQRAFPAARVVKALNTVNWSLMVTPGLVPGDHDVFVAGDDSQAKEVVGTLLVDLGWPAGSVVDLGGLDGARAAEAYVLLSVRLMNLAGTTALNIKVRQG